MQSKRLKLPIGIQNLAEIITEGHYYVDKTRLALQMVRQNKYFFLSRPRRFGKSLLDGGLASQTDLERRIRSILAENFIRLGLVCPDLDDIIVGFRSLILAAHAKHGQRVVILVDEYDKPLLDNLHDREAVLAMRNTLKGFYSVIMGADADIRFAFLTGVSKFSKVSLFSGLSNVRDITVSPEYAAICGYTDHEVATVFAPELEGLDRAMIRHWYNGYNWRGESVYNPYDLLLLFQEREFNSWWFESATPTFLIKLLTERRAWLPGLGQMEATSDLLSAFEVDEIEPVALLFQSGYLTIASEERVNQRQYYQLRFPNEEVRQSLFGCLLQAWAPGAGTAVQHTRSLYKNLAACNMTGLKALFQAFFAAMPYHWHVNNPIADYEGYYASVVYAWFLAAGLDVRVEDATSLGRIDMAVKLSGDVYLFEFKVLELVPDGSALRQIKDKGYADKYQLTGLPIHLVGVEFSREKRNVVGFEFETV